MSTHLPPAGAESLKRPARSAAWYKALSLRERGLPRLPRPAERLASAAARLERWRLVFPSADDFAERLAGAGLTAEQLLAGMGEAGEELRERLADDPRWLAELDEILSAPAGGELPLRFEPDSLLVAAEPFIRHGYRRLRDGLERLAREGAGLPFEPAAAAAMLLRQLPGQLTVILDRTLVLELHVARLGGELAGDTPESRFRSFVGLLGDRRRRLALFQEYPVLARQLAVRVRHWADAGLELLERLAGDWPSITATFALDPADTLTDLVGYLGDRHRGGRSVSRLTFASGSQLIYKPRSLAIDCRFQELLAWLNGRGWPLPFRLLGVIDRGSHGWAECLARRSCEEPAEIERFYRRQGGYLALLYALRASDFHWENLMAVGEQPMLIDVETLFQPHIPLPESADLNLNAHLGMFDSVLYTGLLPQRVGGQDGEEAIDISGIGGIKGQLTSRPVRTWQDRGADTMRLRRQRVPLDENTHHPQLNGRDTHILEHLPPLLDGFAAMYRLLLAERAALLTPGGPLAPFAGVEIRIVLRPTQSYVSLLGESFHPDLLRDALERDCHFDHLWKAAQARPCLKLAIDAERAALEISDIPRFSTTPGSRMLWGGPHDPAAAIPFFAQSGLEVVRRRLRSLGPADLERQLWLIRASCAGLSPIGEATLALPPARGRGPVGPDRLLRLARRAAGRLERLMLSFGDAGLWLDLNLADERYWEISPQAAHLYNGAAGMALFFGSLGAVTGEERYERRGRSALAAMRALVAQHPEAIGGIGGFQGWGGIVYALCRLAELWREPALLDEAAGYVERIAGLISQDAAFDVIGGAAGCIASLAALHQAAPSPRLPEVIARCADHLLANAAPLPGGIGWICERIAPAPLAGFSHGSAGIAWALLLAADLTGQERFRRAAEQAITYENSLFSIAAGNWPDRRVFERGPAAAPAGGERFMAAWCYGAPGIGLARLDGLRFLDTPRIREDIAAAVRTTLAQGFGRNHGLCHGDFGNLEFVLRAGEELGVPEWTAAGWEQARRLVGSLERGGWVCASPLGVETPGLMTGLAGAGYALLRLAAPGQVPSALLLAPSGAGGSR